MRQRAPDLQRHPQLPGAPLQSLGQVGPAASHQAQRAGPAHGSHRLHHVQRTAVFGDVTCVDDVPRVLGEGRQGPRRRVVGEDGVLPAKEVPVALLGQADHAEPLGQAEQHPGRPGQRPTQRPGDPVLVEHLGGHVLVHVHDHRHSPQQAGQQRRRDQLRVVQGHHRDVAIHHPEERTPVPAQAPAAQLCPLVVSAGGRRRGPGGVAHPERGRQGAHGALANAGVIRPVDAGDDERPHRATTLSAARPRRA